MIWSNLLNVGVRTEIRGQQEHTVSAHAQHLKLQENAKGYRQVTLSHKTYPSETNENHFQ